MLALAILQGGWTWTLYDRGDMLVLADEIPDTARLRTTLQCEPGSGIASVDLYEGPIKAGFAILTSGTASATTEASSRADLRTLAVRTDHPVFGQFLLTGALDVAVAGQHQTVRVPSVYLGRLRRFAELCAG